MPEYLPPFGFILMRVGTAGLLFILICLIFIRQKIDFKADFLKIVICAITGCGANMLLFFKGLSITTPINGAILMACTPVFVVVFATFLIKERLTPLRYSGIGIACIGAILLLGGKRFSFDAKNIWGDLAVAANAIIYSFYLVYAKPLLKNTTLLLCRPTRSVSDFFLYYLLDTPNSGKLILAVFREISGII